MYGNRIELTINELYLDAENDSFRRFKGVVKSVFRSMRPSDFENAYLSITKEQGADLVRLIKDSDSKSVVEFGTSFGISTLFLAKGVLETGGRIVTTELIESKALKALQNFRDAGVDHLIDMRVGDAIETLKNYKKPIDLLFLDGWKDLYMPLFRILESNFHADTIVYVDNADMGEGVSFIQAIAQIPAYQVQYTNQGKAAIITANK